MQIYVCVKHVPDSGALIELAGDASYKTDSVKFIPSPFDEYGIEEALALREKHGGEVVVVCAGDAGAISAIRAALAMGADRAIHIVADGQFTDSALAAKAAAQCIAKDAAPDLVFTGKQSIDSEGGRFPYFLAKELNMPVVNDVGSLTMEEDRVLVLREIGGGKRQKIEAPRPCVLGATRGLNDPRYPKLPDIMKAKKKPVTEVAAASLSLGESPSPRLEKLEILPERSGAKLFEGGVPEQVRELLRVLRDEERVL